MKSADELLIEIPKWQNWP